MSILKNVSFVVLSIFLFGCDFSEHVYIEESCLYQIKQRTMMSSQNIPVRQTSYFFETTFKKDPNKEGISKKYILTTTTDAFETTKPLKLNRITTLRNGEFFQSSEC